MLTIDAAGRENQMRAREDSRIQRVLAVMERLSPHVRQEILSSLEMFVSECRQVKQPGSSNGRV